MKQHKLANNNKIQVVSLKLDRDKPRELAFRIFLDQNEANGINRKETILRMFEQLMNQNKNMFMNNFEYEEEEDNNDTDTKINTVSINKLNADMDDLNAL